MAGFRESFWVTTATVAPVLLVAYAATFVDLFSRHRETIGYRRTADRRWAALWIRGVPVLGGLLTLGSVVVVAVGRDDVAERVLAAVLLAALLLGLLSSGLTLISLGRRFPQDAPETWSSER